MISHIVEILVGVGLVYLGLTLIVWSLFFIMTNRKRK